MTLSGNFSTKPEALEHFKLFIKLWNHKITSQMKNFEEMEKKLISNLIPKIHRCIFVFDFLLFQMDLPVFLFRFSSDSLLFREFHCSCWTLHKIWFIRTLVRVTAAFVVILIPQGQISMWRWEATSLQINWKISIYLYI